MNILSQLEALLSPEKRQYAEIKQILPDERLIAITPTNLEVVLIGTANIGDAVFYNEYNKQILSTTQKIKWFDIGI